MRVALLTRGDLFPPHHGAAVKIVRTAEELARASGEPAFVVTDDRDGYLIFDGESWSRRPWRPRFRAAEEWPPVRWAGRQAESFCRRVGYPREEVFLYRPILDPAWWGRAVQVVRQEGCRVLQAEFPGYAAPAAVCAAIMRACGQPGLHTSLVQHNVEWDRLAEFGHRVGRIRRVELGLLRAVDEVIAVSAEDRARMAEAGLPAERITVIPHGVDAARLSRASGRGIRARYGLPEQAPLLFFHGTLHYWPNTEAVRFIAESLLPRLLPALPELRVLICGMSPPLYYAHPAITFAGPVDELAEHVAAADLCLCPVMAGGGTRMKLLEYMAAGKAVVSTAKGAEGIPCRDGKDICIAEGAEGFARAVLELIGDGARRAAIGAAAACFGRRYEWSAVARAYLDLYEGRGRGEDHNLRLREAPLSEGPRDHLPVLPPSKPLTMLLLLNRGCNLRCSFCDLWEGHEQMDVAGRLLPLLDEALRIGTRTLVITGGEPFLHPRLFEAVRAAAERGMAVNITTNGTRLAARWEELVAAPLTSLSISIDGEEQTHDELRGQRGAWRKAWTGLERLREHGGIGLSVYMTVNRRNVGELVGIWRRCLEMGVGFDFWPVNGAPELYFQGAEEERAWVVAVEQLAELDPVVRARRSYYLSGLRYHRGQLGAVRCLGLIDQYGVKYTGELLPCCVWGAEGLAVGNVFEAPLSQLWISPQVQAARRHLWAEGCRAGCFNHSLYELEVATGHPFEPGLEGRGAIGGGVTGGAPPVPTA